MPDVPRLAAPMTGSIRPKTWDPVTRRMLCIWTTGAAVLRDTEEGPVWEILDVAGADLSLMVGAPLLDTHQSDSLDRIIGIVEEVWIEDGIGYAWLRLEEGEREEEIARRIAGGTISGVSVGYDVLQVAEQPAGDDGFARILVVKWVPRELSLVPVPADPAARIRSRSTATMKGVAKMRKRSKRDDDVIDAGAVAADDTDTGASTLGLIADCIDAVCAAIGGDGEAAPTDEDMAAARKRLRGLAARARRAAEDEADEAAMGDDESVDDETQGATKRKRADGDDEADAEDDAAADDAVADEADDAEDDAETRKRKRQIRKIIVQTRSAGGRLSRAQAAAMLIRGDVAAARKDALRTLAKADPAISGTVPPHGQRSGESQARSAIDYGAIYGRINNKRTR